MVSSVPASPDAPPRPTSGSGRPRRVGIELEFGGLEAVDVARLVADRFAGTLITRDSHRYQVADTRYGTFDIELDTRFAHLRDHPVVSGLEPASRARLGKWVGDVASLWLPVEIVTPPLEIADLVEIDHLARALADAGAQGTEDSLIYAFGLQLNPEIATDDAAWLTRMLRAYIVMSDWLRDQIDLDLTRQALVFADPFPYSYRHMVADKDYQPDRDRLIEDYLSHNPTRNRELDMLPLFAHLAPDRVAAHVSDERIKARPTFHYRLPDARLGKADWNIMLEWNRWVMVERLADDPERLAAMADAYRRHLDQFFPGSWAKQAAQWLEE